MNMNHLDNMDSDEEDGSDGGYYYEDSRCDGLVAASHDTEIASPVEGSSIPSSPDSSSSPPTRERSRSIPNQLL